jgi:futalosine hydrolase
MEYLSHRHPNGWIQAGIGGAFDPSLSIGEVYQIQSEMLSGFGAEDRDGRILDPFELGWNDPDGFPFTNGILDCSYRAINTLPLATGMTTFHSSGNQQHIDQLRSKQYGQIENMEGAPFFYISLIKRIPFLSIRSISNMVEPRDTNRWKIDLAIQNLNKIMLRALDESKLNPDKLFRNSAG